MCSVFTMMFSVFTIFQILSSVDCLPESDAFYRLLITFANIPDKKRNAPLRTVQLSGISQVISQFSLYQRKGMSGTAASHVFCNLASKFC